MVISSFGKTFHATGWKVGYCVAPEYLMTEFKKVHQFLTFSTSTPMQMALAEYMVDENTYLGIPQFYKQKRDYFQELVNQIPDSTSTIIIRMGRMQYIDQSGLYALEDVLVDLVKDGNFLFKMPIIPIGSEIIFG